MARGPRPCSGSSWGSGPPPSPAAPSACCSPCPRAPTPPPSPPWSSPVAPVWPWPVATRSLHGDLVGEQVGLASRPLVPGGTGEKRSGAQADVTGAGVRDGDREVPTDRLLAVRIDVAGRLPERAPALPVVGHLVLHPPGEEDPASLIVQ